jgi:hypothetical protein
LHFCFQEWNYELQLLKKDLTDKNGKMKMKKKMNPSPESEAGIAYLKITAVTKMQWCYLLFNLFR